MGRFRKDRKLAMVNNNKFRLPTIPRNETKMIFIKLRRTRISRGQFAGTISEN